MYMYLWHMIFTCEGQKQCLLSSPRACAPAVRNSDE